uniref:Transposase n=1 Tax=Heterorhabditis bacteriophora TaxID=37862 RepID=A0A1I7XSA3_HETBA
MGSDIQKVRQVTSEILDRLPKKPASRDINYLWISCNTVNTIQTESKNSLIFIRKVERELFKYEKNRHLPLEELSAEDKLNIQFDSLKPSLRIFHPYLSIFTIDSLIA